MMRCSGTYKVLLNTHIWPQMMCELADRKSLRISAQDTDFKVKVFLIVVSGCIHRVLTSSLYNYTRMFY